MDGRGTRATPSILLNSISGLPGIGVQNVARQTCYHMLQMIGEGAEYLHIINLGIDLHLTLFNV